MAASYMLYYASDACKNDRDIVLTAVEHHPGSLQCASDTCRNDPEIVLKAVEKDPRCWRFAGDAFDSPERPAAARIRAQFSGFLQDPLEEPDPEEEKPTCPVCYERMTWTDDAMGALSDWVCDNAVADVQVFDGSHCDGRASTSGPWRWSCLSHGINFCASCCPSPQAGTDHAA